VNDKVEAIQERQDRRLSRRTDAAAVKETPAPRCLDWGLFREAQLLKRCVLKKVKRAESKKEKAQDFNLHRLETK